MSGYDRLSAKLPSLTLQFVQSPLIASICCWELILIQNPHQITRFIFALDVPKYIISCINTHLIKVGVQGRVGILGTLAPGPSVSSLFWATGRPAEYPRVWDRAILSGLEELAEELLLFKDLLLETSNLSWDPVLRMLLETSNLLWDPLLRMLLPDIRCRFNAGLWLQQCFEMFIKNMKVKQL